MCGGCPGPDLFLPKQTRSRPEKKKRLPHPFQGITIRKNGKGYCRNQKQKDVSTQFLSASEFLEELLGYVSNLSREDCCVSVQGVARKCECIKFLADKPSIAKVVARRASQSPGRRRGCSAYCFVAFVPALLDQTFS